MEFINSASDKFARMWNTFLLFSIVLKLKNRAEDYAFFFIFIKLVIGKEMTWNVVYPGVSREYRSINV